MASQQEPQILDTLYISVWNDLAELYPEHKEELCRVFNGVYPIVSANDSADDEHYHSFLLTEEGRRPVCEAIATLLKESSLPEEIRDAFRAKLSGIVDRIDENPEFFAKTERLKGEALKLAGQKKYAEARQKWLELYAKDPKNVLVLYNLGMCETALGDRESAYNYFNTAAELGMTQASFQMANVLSSFYRTDLVDKESPQAVRVLNQLREFIAWLTAKVAHHADKNDLNWRYYQSLILVLLNIDEVEEALPYFDGFFAAIKSDPNVDPDTLAVAEQLKGIAMIRAGFRQLGSATEKITPQPLPRNDIARRNLEEILDGVEEVIAEMRATFLSE